MNTQKLLDSFKSHELQQVSILCVSDEESLHHDINSVVGCMVQTIHYASSTHEGIETFHEHRHDILLVSLSFPGADGTEMINFNGIEMIRTMKQLKPEIQVIAISLSLQEDLLLETINVGINRYLPLPIKFPLLLQMLSEVSRIVSVNREIAEVQVRIEEHYFLQGIANPV